MKISHLHIDQFRHLEDLKFDFTYPDDFHDESKRGKPLDKICIIGQSATGKTGILELVASQLSTFISTSFSSDNYFFLNDGNEFNENVYIKFKINDDFFILNKNEIISKNKTYKNYKNIEFSSRANVFRPNIIKNLIIYLKSNLISDKNIKLLNSHPNDIYEKHIDTFKNDLFSFNNTFILNDDIDEKIILFCIKDFVIYLKNFTQKMSELIHKGFLSDTKKLESEYKKWEKDNPKMLKDLAEKLNPLIHKLGLEIDMVNTEFPIPFRNLKTDEIISIDKLSTGTKGLLLSILPIYKLNTKDSIILIDEPERSLYPDIQMEIMEHYQNLAPDAQFIVATHSPFIAASFEPEERFILYFDENGKVKVTKGVSPIGDDPNDLLKNDFKLENLMNKEGIDSFNKYINLKKRLQNEKNEEKKDKILSEILTLANAYKF